MSVDFNTLAQQFCDFYYKQFDQDRSSLGNLYVGIENNPCIFPNHRHFRILTFERTLTIAY